MGPKLVNCCKQETRMVHGLFDVKRKGTPASSLELDLPRVRGALGECGGAGKSGTPGDRKNGLSNSPTRPSMGEDALL